MHRRADLFEKNNAAYCSIETAIHAAFNDSVSSGIGSHVGITPDPWNCTYPFLHQLVTMMIPKLNRHQYKMISWLLVYASFTKLITVAAIYNLYYSIFVFLSLPVILIFSERVHKRVRIVFVILLEFELFNALFYDMLMQWLSN